MECSVYTWSRGTRVPESFNRAIFMQRPQCRNCTSSDLKKMQMAILFTLSRVPACARGLWPGRVLTLYVSARVICPSVAVIKEKEERGHWILGGVAECTSSEWLNWWTVMNVFIRNWWIRTGVAHFNSNLFKSDGGKQRKNLDLYCY